MAKDKEEKDENPKVIIDSEAHSIKTDPKNEMSKKVEKKGKNK